VKSPLPSSRNSSFGPDVGGVIMATGVGSIRISADPLSSSRSVFVDCLSLVA
jgi:hypothetical protein